MGFLILDPGQEQEVKSDTEKRVKIYTLLTTFVSQCPIAGFQFIIFSQLFKTTEFFSIN